MTFLSVGRVVLTRRRGRVHGPDRPLCVEEEAEMSTKSDSRGHRLSSPRTCFETRFRATGRSFPTVVLLVGRCGPHSKFHCAGCDPRLATIDSDIRYASQVSPREAGREYYREGHCRRDVWKGETYVAFLALKCPHVNPWLSRGNAYDNRTQGRNEAHLKCRDPMRKDENPGQA